MQIHFHGCAPAWGRDLTAEDCCTNGLRNTHLHLCSGPIVPQFPNPFLSLAYPSLPRLNCPCLISTLQGRVTTCQDFCSASCRAKRAFLTFSPSKPKIFTLGRKPSSKCSRTIRASPSKCRS